MFFFLFLFIFFFISFDLNQIEMNNKFLQYPNGMKNY